MAVRLAGRINLTINGQVVNVASGNVEYKTDEPEKEMLVGPDRVHGHKSMPVAPFIAGELRVGPTFDESVLRGDGPKTVVLLLADGRAFVLNDAVDAGEWTGGTEEGIISFRYEGTSSAFVAAA